MASAEDGTRKGAERRKPIPDHPAVYRFLSGHGFPKGPPQAEEPPIVFHHVPKTGGTYLTDLIVHNLQQRDVPHLFYAPHWMSAAESARIFGAERRIALVLRDPVARFASAFGSRLREGRPGYVTPWNDHERAFFKAYPDLAHFAAALTSPWPRRRKAARKAVAGMPLLPRGYNHLFPTLHAARAAAPEIALALPLRRLKDDLDGTMATLGFPSYEMPPAPEENRAPPDIASPSALTRARLRLALAREVRIYIELQKA